MKRMLILALFLAGASSFAEDGPMPSAGESHAKDVMALRFSPDGRTLYSSGADAQIFGWDPETGRKKTVFYGVGSAAFAIAVSGDGKLLAASEGSAKAVTLWNAETGKKLRTLYMAKEAAEKVAFSPDGLLLAVGGKDGVAAVYDTARGSAVAGFRLGDSVVTGLEFSADSSTLYATSANGTFSVIDITNRKIARTAKLAVGAGINASDVSADGRLLAAACADKKVYVFDLETLAVKWALQEHAKAVRSVAFGPDGKTVVSGGYDDKVVRWDAVQGKKVSVRTNLTGIVWDLAFAADGSRYACAAGKTIVMADGATDKGLRIWMKK